MRGLFLIGANCLLLVASLGADTFGDFLSLQRRLIQVFEENQDAVVRVKGAFEQAKPDGQNEVVLKVGTGFFISREGHILANSTRTIGANRIWVEHRGIDYAAETVGQDRVNNIALLRLITLPPDFGVIRMGESAELPEIGSMAVSIAYYLDFEAAPSIGLVQNYARRYGSSIFPTTFLRISISNDLGEGGAPILDLNGRLIGMMIAALPDIRACFALPSRAVMRIRDDLLFEGEVRYSWIGIEVDPEIDWAGGGLVSINSVLAGTPAEQAGILPGDSLLQVGEFPIQRVEDYPNASFFTRPGQFVTVRVRRNEELLTFNLRTVARPNNEPIIVTQRPGDSPPAPVQQPPPPVTELPNPSPRLPETRPAPVPSDPDPVGPPAPRPPSPR